MTNAFDIAFTTGFVEYARESNRPLLSNVAKSGVPLTLSKNPFQTGSEDYSSWENSWQSGWDYAKSLQ